MGVLLTSNRHVLNVSLKKTFVAFRAMLFYLTDHRWPRETVVASSRASHFSFKKICLLSPTWILVPILIDDKNQSSFKLAHCITSSDGYAVGYSEQRSLDIVYEIRYQGPRPFLLPKLTVPRCIFKASETKLYIRVYGWWFRSSFVAEHGNGEVKLV